MFMMNFGGAVEYTDSFSAEELKPLSNECPVYDSKNLMVRFQ